MEFKEYRAKTVNDAITDALIELETTSDKIEYEVIEEGSSGLLGLFSKDAIVRVRRKEEPVFEEEIIELRASLVEEEPAEAKPAKKTWNEKKSRKAKEDRKFDNKVHETSMKADDEIHETAAKAKDRIQESAVRSENKDREPAKAVDRTVKAGEKPAKAETEANGQTEELLPLITGRDAENEDVNAILKVIFEKLDIKADVSTTIDPNEKVVTVLVDGEDTGDLIGKRGQTLDAIQYLLSIVINKKKDTYYRVKLDTNNYRERRQKTLENLAKNVASKVKKTRKKVALEPMNPYERRVIHSYLQSDKFVTTKSEGEEPNRRVVVYYKKS